MGHSGTGPMGSSDGYGFGPDGIGSEYLDNIKKQREPTEGKIKKGGVNKKPTRSPPPPPLGEGGHSKQGPVCHFLCDKLRSVLQMSSVEKSKIEEKWLIELVKCQNNCHEGKMSEQSVSLLLKNDVLIKTLKEEIKALEQKVEVLKGRRCFCHHRP